MIDESGATDYYKYTLALKMIRDPGKQAVYCSIQPNLVGGVLRRAAKQSLPVLFQNLLAEPLQIKRYYRTSRQPVMPIWAAARDFCRAIL